MTQALWVDLRTLSFKEAAGLEVKQLAFDLKANQQQATLRDLVFNSTNSKIGLGTLQASYKLNNKKLDINSLRYNIKDFKALIQPSDFTSIFPELKTLTASYTASLRCSRNKSVGKSKAN